MINSAIKQIALVVGSTLIAMAGVHAQTSCPIVSGDTTVSSSCDTGISLTGANLTIGTPTSGLVEVSNPDATVINVSGMRNSIDNTANGAIYSGDLQTGIYNAGIINTLNNSGTISAVGSGDGIYNGGTIITLDNSSTISAGDIGVGIANIEGIIFTLTNSGTISAGNFGVGIANSEGIIDSLTNSGTISAGDRGIGIINGGTITTLTNSGTISAGEGGAGIVNFGTIDTLANSGTILTGESGWGIIIEGGTVTTLTNAPSVPSASAIASQVRSELSVELGRIDAATSTRATPANIPTSDITAIKGKTDLLNTTRLAQVSTTEILGNLLAQANS